MAWYVKGCSFQIRQGFKTVLDLQFRMATIDDADMLFQWRNDPETRKQSHNTDEVNYDGHVAWLKASLVNPNREIRIAELNGVAVGTIRLDTVNNECLLSWAVASAARGKGIGKTMLSKTIETRSLPMKAEVKADNAPSRRMAEYAAMVLEREENGVAYYGKR